MKLHRLLLACAAAAGLVAVAVIGQSTEPAGSRMAAAAQKFLGTLSDEQKARSVFAFDDKERLNWHFVPLQDEKKNPTRKGVRLEEMNADQKTSALNLLKAGTSPDGYNAATTIMSLEAILREAERGGASVRNPDWYFFTVFGTPGKTGKWGWRVEGHHLSLNFTLADNQVVSATPAFFGANPATVKDGPRKGQRALAAAEDLARDLFASLDAEQKKTALQPAQFGEIQGRTPAPKVGEPKGLAASKMNDKQRATLLKLLESYAQRLPAEVAEDELKRVKEAGLDKVHFAFAEEDKPGKPYTYRVQGPTFVVEFLNVQADGSRNPANHIHSAWRALKGDFGLAN